jgi:hypothetical protein
MATNLGNAQQFFTYWAATPSSPQIDAMMKAIFSPDTGTAPSLGIAAGNAAPSTENQWQGPQLGPQFVGVKNVTLCFNRIITSFPSATFTTLPVNNAVYLQGNNQVAVPAVLITGPHKHPWFQFDSGAYSKPLSDLEPDGNQQSLVPACAIFTFDNNSLITNLAIFMDRWQMAADLWPTKPIGNNKVPRPFPMP